jgi:iron complex outermembrane receptor protein
MRNIFLLLLLLLGIYSNSFSKPLTMSPPGLQGVFTGKITDARTGEPISGVTIYFTDIKTGGSTNAQGIFTIRNISEDKHMVEISHIGYNSIIETVEISGNTQKNYTLTEAVIENNTVIVTGVTGATQTKKVPFSVEVLRSKDFFQNTSTNIMESLTKIGGVNTLATGPAISKPVIRGLSYNRVLTVNDGVRQEGQQWGDEHGIEVDEASVNKIEVLKGPASVIYGSDALAGVINIITNVPAPVNTLKANIGSNYQTNNKLRTLNANIGANHDGFNWNIYSSNKIAQDYTNKYDGRVFNSKFNEHNLGGYAGYNGKWGYSHLLVSNFNLTAGLVEGERDDQGRFVKPVAGGGQSLVTPDDYNSTTPLIPYQHIQHFKIASDNNIKINQNHLSFNLGFQHNQREEFGNPDNTAERSLFFDLKTITYTAQYLFHETAGFKSSIGINGMQQNNKNLGMEQLVPDYDLLDFGMYGYTQKTMGKITLSGGARYDTRNIDAKNLLEGATIKGDAFKKQFSSFSGSVGLAAQVSEKLNLKLNIARGFRAPSIPELASNGAHEGTIRYEYGDPNLKNETSLQLDAGASLTGQHVSVDFSAFYNKFNNFIFYRKLQTANGTDSIVRINGSDFSAFKFDQSRASLAGFEVEVDVHPHPLDWLHLSNTFSYVRGILKDEVEGSRNLPSIPAAKLVSELRANFKNLSSTIRNFYAKLELDNTFRQNHVFTAFNTETPTAGYSLFNAGIGTDVMNKKGTTLFSVSLGAINLTDVAYQNHLSRLKYAPENLATGRTGIYNMGRNFSLKLNIPLSIDLKARKY